MGVRIRLINVWIAVELKGLMLLSVIVRKGILMMEVMLIARFALLYVNNVLIIWINVPNVI